MIREEASRRCWCSEVLLDHSISRDGDAQWDGPTFRSAGRLITRDPAIRHTRRCRRETFSLDIRAVPFSDSPVYHRYPVFLDQGRSSRSPRLSLESRCRTHSCVDPHPWTREGYEIHGRFPSRSGGMAWEEGNIEIGSLLSGFVFMD